jgi:uncharacterized protein YbbK (DUF523 family)
VLPRVGVSACLLGRAVRWDGGHKWSALVEGLGRCVEWVAVCPEVELGLGVPRPPIDWVEPEGGGGPRLVILADGRDITEEMARHAARRIDELAAGGGLDGYVLKARSPSCGLGRGAFARVLAARMPGIPLIEEGDLEDEGRRAAFLAAVRTRAAGAGRGPGSPGDC